MKKLITALLIVVSLGFSPAYAQDTSTSSDAAKAAYEALPSSESSEEEIVKKIEALVKANPDFVSEIVTAASKKYLNLNKQLVYQAAKAGIINSPKITAANKLIAQGNLDEIYNINTYSFDALPNNKVLLVIEPTSGVLTNPRPAKLITTVNP